MSPIVRNGLKAITAHTNLTRVETNDMNAGEEHVDAAHQAGKLLLSGEIESYVLSH